MKMNQLALLLGGIVLSTIGMASATTPTGTMTLSITPQPGIFDVTVNCNQGKDILDPFVGAKIAWSTVQSTFFKGSNDADCIFKIKGVEIGEGTIHLDTSDPAHYLGTVTATKQVAPYTTVISPNATPASDVTVTITKG